MAYFKIDFNKIPKWQDRRPCGPPWPLDFLPMVVKVRYSEDLRCEGYRMALFPQSHPGNPNGIAMAVYTWAADNIVMTDERWCIVEHSGLYDDVKALKAWFSEEAVEEIDAYQFIQACDAARMYYTDG